MLLFARVLSVLVHLIFVPVDAIVWRQTARHSFCKLLLVGFSLFSTVAVGADVFFLFAGVFVTGYTVRAIV